MMQLTRRAFVMLAALFTHEGPIRLLEGAAFYGSGQGQGTASAAAAGSGAAAKLAGSAAAEADRAIVARLRSLSLPDLVKALPPDLIEKGNALVTATSEDARATAGNQIAGEVPALELVLAWLVRDHGVKELQYTLMNIYAYPHFLNDPRTRAVLRHLVLTSPEAAIVSEAASQWRALQLHDLHETVVARIDTVRESGPPALWEAMLPIDDWARNLRAGTMLPRFLRQAPPLITTRITGERVRLFAFGDFGFGSDAQKAVAAQMRRVHAEEPFDFGMTLGDNFYPRGLSSLDDPRWQTQFEELYGTLGVDVYASLGNHDRMYDPDSAIAEILYTRRGGRWQLPSSFYTYTAGPAQFFVIDTVELSELQLRWLTQALDASTARWKVVYGHYPAVIAYPNFLTATGAQGEMMRRRLAAAPPDERRRLERTAAGENPELIDRLMPVLKGRADLYLAGHHHSLQHLAPLDGVELFIVGAGGASSYPVGDNHPRAKFAKSVYGFAAITIDPRTFALRFIDLHGQEIYQTAINKA